MLREINQTKEGQILYVSIFMSYLQLSAHRDRKDNGDWQDLGGWAMESYSLMGRQFQFGKMKRYGWW